MIRSHIEKNTGAASDFVKKSARLSAERTKGTSNRWFSLYMYALANVEVPAFDVLRPVLMLVVLVV